MKHVGVFGLRGYNVIYSGYETFAKYLVAKSDKKHFFYYLFSRSRYKKYEKQTKGVNFKSIHVQTAEGKHLETFTYNFTATFASFFQPIDIVLYLGTANTLFILVQKLLRRKTIVNTAGVDWKKKRWTLIGKMYLLLCEKLTVLFADVILCDSKSVMDYYKNNYKNQKIIYIPYGAEVTARKPGELLKKIGVIPHQYFYTVGRISPENCFEDIILAFQNVITDYKCIIIGNSIYEDEYKKKLQKMAFPDKRIIFAGFQKGKDYEEICSNAFGYIESKSIGGTHPSLLEAIAFNKPVIVKNIPENVEVVQTSAYLYKENNLKSLTDSIYKILKEPEIAKKRAHLTKSLIQDSYNWRSVVTQYEQLFNSLV